LFAVNVNTGEIVWQAVLGIKDFSRDKIRVLAHVDVSKLDMQNPRVHRADGDYPVAWSKMYGKGRVFIPRGANDRTTPSHKHSCAGANALVG
jgi:type 1 glutamine amidotransferase